MLPKYFMDNFKYIFDAMSEGVYIANNTGLICYVNPVIEKQEGFPLASIAGKHITEVYPVTEVNSPMLQVLKKRTPVMGYHSSYMINGKQTHHIGNALPLTIDENMVGVVAIVQDITKLKEIIEDNIDLQQKNTGSKSASSKLESETSKTYYTFDQIIGDNILLSECKKSAQKAAKTDSPVLLFGETGTGKELFAQSIHSASKRAIDPFLAINCAAIPETLLESILFGTSKGIYTGAIDRPGLLEQANGGTLFLDEINSMSLSLQAKLLRVLEEKCVQRLGSKENIAINARIISSCNIEPIEAIEKKQLRADLFYRLAVLYIVIPPLRERASDIELLTSYFINHFNGKHNKNIQGIHKDIFPSFINYQWSGNVRQLKHCIECAISLADSHSAFIEAKHIPQYLKMFSNATSETPSWDYNLINTAPKEHGQEDYNLFVDIENEEKNAIIKILRSNNGNITKSAKEMGLSRTQMIYRLKKYNLYY